MARIILMNTSGLTITRSFAENDEDHKESKKKWAAIIRSIKDKRAKIHCLTFLNPVAETAPKRKPDTWIKEALYRTHLFRPPTQKWIEEKFMIFFPNVSDPTNDEFQYCTGYVTVKFDLRCEENRATYEILKRTPPNIDTDQQSPVTLRLYMSKIISLELA